LVEDHLGAARPRLAARVAGLYDRLAQSALGAGRLDEACALHGKAGGLAAADPAFAVALAGALEGAEVAPDVCLEVLHGWIVGHEGDDQELGRTPVAQAYARLLTIDARRPEVPGEVQRFARWSRAAAEARPR